MNASTVNIEQGSMHIMVGFDVGFEIKLSDLPTLFPSRMQTAIRHRAVSQSISRETRPLRISYDTAEIELLGQRRQFDVYATFFDVGGLSLEFVSPLHADLSILPRLSEATMNSKDLVHTAREIADQIFELAKSAIVNPEVYKTPSTFTVFNLQKLSQPFSAQLIHKELGEVIAQTLRNSDEAIGTAEIERTLNPNVTYSDEDVVFASLNAAVIFDEESFEVIDIFELANIQFMELRYIDDRLDRTLLSLYSVMDKSSGVISSMLNLFEAQSRRLNTIHLDSTMLVERIEQSFKFSTDSYLVRVHELCVSKMFLGTLVKGIDRKLKAIRDINSDMRDRASSIRMEILEWIIIVLILAGTVPVLVDKLK